MPACSYALRVSAFLACCVLTVAVASAQQSYPMLMSLKPVAVQAGTTASCEVQSRYTMAGAHQVLVTGGHVSAEVVPPPEPKAGEKPKDVTKLELKFTVAPEAQPGVREFRLVTPQGVSTVGQLVIVRDPVIVEAKDNDVREKAQHITLPAVLAGALEKREDFDFYKFQVEAGSAWTFHVPHPAAGRQDSRPADACRSDSVPARCGRGRAGHVRQREFRRSLSRVSF